MNVGPVKPDIADVSEWPAGCGALPGLDQGFKLVENDSARQVGDRPGHRSSLIRRHERCYCALCLSPDGFRAAPQSSVDASHRVPSI
jgi:hypothetical protein